MTAISPTRGTVASDIARAWLRLYTVGLPAGVRERRAQELESDLWEHESDRFAGGTAASMVGIEILGRMVRGMPADLLWRFHLEGPQMDIKIPFERMTGLLLLSLVILIPIATSINGYDTGREGWGNELSRLGDNPEWQRNLTIAFQVLCGVALVGAGAGFSLALRGRSRNLATFAAFALATAGVLTLVASAVYAMVSEMATEYLAGRGGDNALITSRTLAVGMDRLAESALVLLATGVYLLAFAAARHALVPSWLRWVAVLSAVLLAASVIADMGAADGAAWGLLGGALVALLLWLLVAGVSLLLGYRGPAVPRHALAAETA
ncbi:MAG: DUF4386 family protein [Chloroflexi bacterium]|nr:DUF4386 family protein [Chloroflexota bacterium]